MCVAVVPQGCGTFAKEWLGSFTENDFQQMADELKCGAVFCNALFIGLFTEDDRHDTGDELQRDACIEVSCRVLFVNSSTGR